jgi:hypothetical protein
MRCIVTKLHCKKSFKYYIHTEIFMHLRTILFTMTIITFTTLALPNISTSLSFVTIVAYAQTPGGPGSSLPNPADLGLPAYNSSSSSAPSDNSTDLSDLSPSASDLGAVGNNSTNPAYATQTTQSATVPEFGPVSFAVLVVSVMSIILVSARAKLRFS